LPSPEALDNPWSLTADVLVSPCRFCHYGQSGLSKERRLAAGFFDGRQAAAVLKHGVLQRYLPVFIGKTGSRSPGKRVVYIDGYAGPGMYQDGTPGSPELALRTAIKLAEMREVECFFVERDRSSYETLRTHLERTGHRQWTAYRGRVEDHLDDMLSRAVGLPLFAFLDPFGMALPLDMLTGRLLARAMGRGWRRTPTEVLLNFSAWAVKRQAGLLDKTFVNPARAKAGVTTLAKLDRFLGGAWWRPIWRSEAEDRIELILDGYVNRLRRVGAGWTSWTVPVADRWGGRPDYCLIFLTQHHDGVWAFGEALSGATEEYYQFCHQGQLDLDPEPTRKARWIEALVANLETLLVPRQATFALLRISPRRRSRALRFRQAM
jgi:three-Cys-motif partner protein